MASIFDRYLLRRYLSTFLILFVSTYGLYVVIDGFSNVDDFQVRADTTGEMLQAMAKHYSYQSTAFFNMMAPILAIISVLVVVAMLYKQTEITPMLSAGVPVSRLMRPFLAGAVLVNVIAWIKARRLQWMGHILRLKGEEESRLIHKAVEYMFNNTL